MLTGPLFGILEESGYGVLTLAENLTREELLAARLTCREVAKLLQTMADTAAGVPAEVRERMPEIDWAGWAELGRELRAGGDAGAPVWRGRADLVPATLMWLRVYRKQLPELFSYKV